MKHYSCIMKVLCWPMILSALFLAACSGKTVMDDNTAEFAESETDISEDISEENGQSVIAEDAAEDEETETDSSGKIEISMEEAISIGTDEAVQYYDNLMLVQVSSYDNDADREIDAGIDGKREWWYVEFANEQDNFVSILIADGEILYAECFDENGGRGLINADEVKMTSVEAVEKASAAGLAGGDPENESQWVSGYNFDLSYTSLASEPDEYKIFLEVIGISPNGNFAHVDFDATTGELLLVEEKIEHPNGEVEWVSW